MNKVEFSKDRKNSKSDIYLIILKMSVLLVVLLVPLAFMAYDFSKVRSVNNNINLKAPNNEDKPQAKNFEVHLPVANAGDLSSVDPEKIETLFDNLKY